MWPLLALLAAAKPAWTEPSRDELAAALRAAADAPTVAERLELATRPLLGAPYVLSPLGEGGGPDPDPRLRLDAFDCTTFVETALALASTDDLDGLEAALDAIRYRGAPGFSRRRHLIESSWVPDLIADGVLEDVTATVGGARTVREPFVLTPRRWRQRHIAKELSLPEDELPFGAKTVAWIPLEALDAFTLEPGAVVNVVREDVAWSPTRVTHQGLLLRDPRTGKLVVRHASPVAKRVIDEPLERMIGRYRYPKIEKKWRLVGISVLAVRARARGG